jgi:hypothetical protein
LFHKFTRPTRCYVELPQFSAPLPLPRGAAYEPLPIPVLVGLDMDELPRVEELVPTPTEDPLGALTLGLPRQEAGLFLAPPLVGFDSFASRRASAASDSRSFATARSCSSAALLSAASFFARVSALMSAKSLLAPSHRSERSSCCVCSVWLRIRHHRLESLFALSTVVKET